MTRHNAIAVLLMLAVTFTFQTTAPAASPREDTDLPISGEFVPGMANLDVTMTALMHKWQLPGGQLAVAKAGHLVFARGYGYANLDQSTPVQPDSLFRIASVSKLFTATAIMTLVDEGKLSLDMPAFGILNVAPPDGATMDPRIASITVRELLQHTAGFDRSVNGDPIEQTVSIAEQMGVAAPADCPTLTRYLLERPLDFDPGTNGAYSNVGYCVLGQVIEAASGMAYANYVHQSVLAPAGLTRAALARTRADDRLPDEVSYYDYPSAPLVPSVFGGSQDLVPAPYGKLPLEGLGPPGGWIASAVDLVKFSTAVDGRRGPPLLQPQSLAAMAQSPSPSGYRGSPFLYTTLGWDMRRPYWGDVTLSKAGKIAGSFSYLVHMGNGWDWAVSFNSAPQDAIGLERDVDAQIIGALVSLTETPGSDAFDQFP